MIEFANNKDDAVLARAMRDIENDILDLRDMASVMEAVVEQTLEGTGVVNQEGERHVTLNEHQIRRLVFISYEVERRARELSDRYQGSFPAMKEIRASRSKAAVEAA